MSVEHEVAEWDIHGELSNERIKVACVREVPEANVTGMRSDGLDSFELKAELVNIRTYWIVSRERRAIELGITNHPRS